MEATVFTIDARALTKAVLHVSKDKRSSLLRHVCCEAGGVLVASDGHTLLGVRDAHSSSAGVLLLPTTELVSMAKKAAKKEDRLEVVAYPSPAGGSAQVTWGGTTVTVDVGGWEFGDWRKIVTRAGEPEAVSVVGLDGTLAARFGVAQLVWHGPKMPIYVRPLNDEYEKEHCFGLLMPRQLLDEVDVAAPEWAKPQEPEQPAFEEDEQEAGAEEAVAA